MKTVFLTTGPRGAGKSSYCKKVIERHPYVEFFSRDEILVAMFGRTELSPYEGGHECARETFLEKVRAQLSSVQGDSLILLDYWNGSQRERQTLIRHLRGYGAERIIAWYFVTPLEICMRWFMQKEESLECSDGMKKVRMSGCKRDFHLYHRLAADITDDGFDQVVQIDPCQLALPGFPFM